MMDKESGANILFLAKYFWFYKSVHFKMGVCRNVSVSS